MLSKQQEERTNMSFIEVLNTEEGRNLVDQIEELVGETEVVLVEIRTRLIKQLKDEFGYDYTL